MQGLMMNLTVAEIAAYVAVALNVAVYWTRTMIPLRLFAITVNLLFILYASLDHVYPTLVLNCILLPLNLLRLREMIALTRRVQAASESGFDFNWLRPFTSQVHVAAGETMFRKNDPANTLYLIVSGKFVLVETSMALAPGTVVGEMGLLSPGGLRTQTLRCDEAGDVLAISYDHFKEIYFQNPKFGFYFLKLITSRLFENNKRLETALAAREAAAT